jgi:predicted Co/Zn/Cd cation transporter (cation efflux family)
VTEFFHPGSGERVKYAVHGGLFTLAAICASYNAVAWCLRGDRHLARNTAIYSALAALELAQMERHR